MISLLALPALLAQSGYRYIPFQTPLPVWDYWMWLVVPLCAAIAIVYKSVRCPSMSQVPRQAAALLFFILVVMALAAVGLFTLVRMLD